ncbi:MAG: SUMF1/EgtB/PvdO family nonheme iron enzyme [Deltaproteobacteria bacterium]|nr:SUMF1/EgtB/PvdO family nonheme iron enzyme [Deltaproteobacteria bacterium]
MAGTFRLGFPLEADLGQPAWVLVRATPSRNHYVVGGRPGALRNTSGAALAAMLAPSEVTDSHKLELTPTPSPPATAAPADLAYSGVSDGAACALALAGPSLFGTEGGAVVLVSCAIQQLRRNEAFHGVTLNRVTDASRPDPANVASLLSKWEAAKTLASPTGCALILHRADATLLSQAASVPVASYRILETLPPGQATLIGVRESDMPQLAAILGCETDLFLPLRRSHAFGVARRAALLKAATALALGVALGAGAATAVTRAVLLADPSFVAFECNDQGNFIRPGETSRLRLLGDKLSQRVDEWLPRWTAALAEEGVRVVARGLVKDAGAADSSIAVDVAVPREFDNDSLPLPTLATDARVTLRAPVTVRERLRMAVVDYSQGRDKAFERLFEMLGERIRSTEPRFDARPYIKPFDQDDIDTLVEEVTAGRWDIVRVTPWVYLQLKWALAQRKNGPTLRLSGCGRRRDVNGATHTTYQSVVFAARGETPGWRKPLRNADDLKFGFEQARAHGRRPQFFWGKHNSTSGYVVPCILFGDVVRAADAWNEGGSNDETRNLVLAHEPRVVRLGASYDATVDPLVATNAGRDNGALEILWRSQPIPHGGIAVVHRGDDERSLVIERNLRELLVKLEADPTMIPESAHQDVDGIGTCEVGLYTELEKYVLAHSDQGTCALRAATPKTDLSRGTPAKEAGTGDAPRGTATPAAVDSSKLSEEMADVPPGMFVMGTNDGPENERPARQVILKGFQLDRTEVTVAAYRQCVDAGACSPPRDGGACNWGHTERKLHPVNCVTWFQANAYCSWSGKRLPTEEEWEYAACGSDGRTFPWGVEPPGDQLCWDGEGNDLGKGNRHGTCVVGSHPRDRSPFGVLDMGGNVWEWVATPYRPYGDTSSVTEERSDRGGGWGYEGAAGVRCKDRFHKAPSFSKDVLGFRCARDK